MRNNRLGRLVFYREHEPGHRPGMLPSGPLKVAGVLEYQPWNYCYLVRALAPDAQPFVVPEEQVVADGYLTAWPPPDDDRKQVAEGLAGRMDVLGRECAVLAEKLRRSAA